MLNIGSRTSSTQEGVWYLRVYPGDFRKPESHRYFRCVPENKRPGKRVFFDTKSFHPQAAVTTAVRRYAIVEVEARVFW